MSVVSTVTSNLCCCTLAITCTLACVVFAAVCCLAALAPELVQFSPVALLPALAHQRVQFELEVDSLSALALAMCAVKCFRILMFVCQH